MAKHMKRCLTKTLPSSDESPVVFREDNHGHDRHQNHRTNNNKKKKDEKKPKKKQIMKNKKTSLMMRKMIDRRHIKVGSSDQTYNLTESRSSRSLQDSPTDVESGDTYNTSVSSSSSPREQPEHRTTSKAAVAPKNVVLPTNTMGGEGIVFSFRPHKSKKKRNGKNVKLTGPMKLSRRLS